MKLKTVSVDVEAFRLLRRAKGPRESYGDVVRRVFAQLAAEEVDVEKHLAELMAHPPEVDTALLRRRQGNPPSSRRPARRRAA
jgi:predicted CopG family antitoxin